MLGGASRGWVRGSRSLFCRVVEEGDETVEENFLGRTDGFEGDERAGSGSRSPGG